VNPCTRPIDPLDAEALAAGAGPVVARDAGDHVARCNSCRALVESAEQLTTSLEASVPAEGPAPDLAARVVRLRAFSRRERRDLTLWRGGLGLVAGVFLAGLLLITLPVWTAGEQAGLGLAAAAPFLALLQSLLRSITQAAGAAPVALDALAQSLRGERALGLGALALLAPVLFGLKWAVARARK
jgi:hypothetical protein